MGGVDRDPLRGVLEHHQVDEVVQGRQVRLNIADPLVLEPACIVLGERFVDDQTDREHICWSVDVAGVLPLHLFGGEVVPVREQRCLRGEGGVLEVRYAEICENQVLPVRVDQDVLRLDVSVHDLFAVDILDGIAQLGKVLEEDIRVVFVSDDPSEACAVQVHHVVEVLLVFRRSVDFDDIWVCCVRAEVNLALEAFVVVSVGLLDTLYRVRLAIGGGSRLPDNGVPSVRDRRHLLIGHAVDSQELVLHDLTVATPTGGTTEPTQPWTRNISS